MGRFVNSSVKPSDVAYALCTFGATIGAYYRLLDADFLPARNVPNMAPAVMPTNVTHYASYGVATPTGFGVAIEPIMALGGALSGPHNTTGASTNMDGAVQQAITNGGANTPPGNNNNNLDNHTSRCGEYGHDRWNLRKSGAIVLPQRNATYGIETKTEANDAFVNADLADPDLTLMLWKGTLYLALRANVETVVVSGGARGFISKFVVPGIATDFYGSASYNRSRNELVIVGGASGSSSPNAMWLRSYRDLPDIGRQTDIGAVLGAITPTQITLTAWSPATPAATAESIGGATPVLTNNGDVFISFFNAGAALYCGRLPRLTDTTWGPMVSALSWTVTTSYGRNTARGSGMSVMQTRDGETVACYSQYYYYGSGIGVMTINKRTNSAKLAYSDAESNTGRSLLHWGKSGFAVAFNASGAMSATAAGNVLGYDCSVQDAATSPTQIVLPIPNGNHTTGIYPFYVELSA